MPIDPNAPWAGFGRAGGGVPGFPENGTAYLIFDVASSLAGSMMRGAGFGLHSVDLSEFSTLYQYQETVRFVGYRADGSMVTTEFTTDGIMDGTGPLPDFQTFYFDERFSQVVRFEIPGSGYALDNLVFYIPEPGSGSLLIIGTFLAIRRRARSHCNN